MSTPNPDQPRKPGGAPNSAGGQFGNKQHAEGNITTSAADRVDMDFDVELDSVGEPELWLSLSGDAPSISTNVRPEWQNGATPDVWHRRSGVTLPAAVGKDFVDTMESQEEEIAELAERIWAGHSIEWDGNNHVGVFDEDATEALAELEALCQEAADSADTSTVLTPDGFDDYFLLDDDDGDLKELASDRKAALALAREWLADDANNIEADLGAVATWIQAEAAEKLAEQADEDTDDDTDEDDED